MSWTFYTGVSPLKTGKPCKYLSDPCHHSVNPFPAPLRIWHQLIPNLPFSVQRPHPGLHVQCSDSDLHDQGGADDSLVDPYPCILVGLNTPTGQTCDSGPRLPPRCISSSIALVGVSGSKSNIYITFLQLGINCRLFTNSFWTTIY